MSDTIRFLVAAFLVALIAGATGVAMAEYMYGDLAQVVANIAAWFR